jgi:hypothetical protein
MVILKLGIVLMFAVCYSDEGKIIITQRLIQNGWQQYCVFKRVYFLLLLIVFNKEWDDSMWSFWVEANVSILCYIYIYIVFFIYVLPLAINFFKILLYFKCIYIDIIFMQDATDELLKKKEWNNFMHIIFYGEKLFLWIINIAFIYFIYLLLLNHVM